ncbi:MAG: taurine ABC transporter substrate-binding protein [Acidobacteria bacterium]|nr:MAG: taurine ABC transporter substrate-binding protein [Acidobacteriota bacterium]
MKKILTTLLFAVMIALPVTATAADEKQQNVRVIMPTGVPAISMAEMVQGKGVHVPGYKVNYQVLESPDMLAGKLISGEAELAVVPTNLAIKLYNKGVKVKYGSGVVWGILYVISQEKTNNWQALKGKEIYTLGRGLTPDIVLRYLLTKNGLTPDKDVSIHYANSTTELAPAFLVGKSRFSLIPEPALSMVMKKKPATNIMFDLQKEWAKATGISTGYPQASLIMIGDFADKHPDFIRKFMEAYKESIKKVNADPARAGKMAATYLKTPKAPVIAHAIPRSNLKWVSASEARKPLETYFKVLRDFNPAVIGGKMPDDAFYYVP